MSASCGSEIQHSGGPYRFVRQTWPVLVMAAMVGCSTGSPSPPMATDVASSAPSSLAKSGGGAQDGVVLSRIDEPPLVPPLLEISGQSVEAISYEWFDRGHRTTAKLQPSSSLTAADLPVLPTPAHGSIELKLLTSVAPGTVEAHFFAGISHGTPTSETVSTLCSSSCKISTEGSVQLRVETPSSTRVIVIIVNYTLPADPANPGAAVPVFDVVSYGTRLEG